MDAAAAHLATWPDGALVLAPSIGGVARHRAPTRWLKQTRTYADGTDYRSHNEDATRRDRVLRALSAFEGAKPEDYEVAHRELLGGRALYRDRLIAFSRQGRRVHGVVPRLAERFRARQVLIGSASDPFVRAALRYLDVVFLHPFVDGNARAARIVLEAELNRSGIALLVPFSSLVSFPKRAGDRSNNLAFARLVRRVCEVSAPHRRAEGVYVR